MIECGYSTIVTVVKQRKNNLKGRGEMKREDLKAMGLTEEQIEKVMAENGKDIQAEKDNTATKQKEVDTLNGQLKTANDDIKAFKDMNIDEIKQKSAEWEQKYKDTQADLKKVRENALIDKSLSSINAHDVDVVKGLLKMDSLVFKDNEVIGLDAQIEALKKEKAFLFKEDGGSIEQKETNPKFSTEKRTATGQEEKPATLREAVAAAIGKKE